MFSISNHAPRIGTLKRREFVRMGAVGGMGLSLPMLLDVRNLRAAGGDQDFGRAKRCILVFLNGGPSQLDTWDMKPNAPAEIRGELRPIATNVAGIQVSELLPLTARHADKYKIVRSVTHPCSVHTTGVYTMLTGTIHETPKIDQTRALPKDHPHLGSVVAKWRGWQDGLPPFVSLPSLFAAPPVDGIWPGQNAGFLGRRFDPFVIQGNKQSARFNVPALKLPGDVNAARLENRKSLLHQLSRTGGAVETDKKAAEWDTVSQQAYSLLGSSAVQSAFDLKREPDKVRDQYGRHLFGQGILLARRLIEAEIPLVTIYWNDPEPAGAGGGEYDSHGRIYHHYPKRLLPPTDRALAALFSDLEERGLFRDTLVVVMGEFGRTPRINKDAGRDHWPQVQSILLAGAGISGGSVFGASDRIASEPAGNPVTPPDLAQSIFHLLGVPADLELHDPLGRAVRACQGNVIPGLYS